MFRAGKAGLAITLGIAAMQPIVAHATNTPVVVVNTTTTPVPTKVTVAPHQYEVSWFSGTTSGFTETSSFTMPADKGYVIEGISCEAYAPSSTEVMIKITTTAGGAALTHYITGFISSKIYTNYWILGQIPIKIYADAGTSVTIDVVRQSPAGASIGYYSDVILSGHYIAPGGVP